MNRQKKSFVFLNEFSKKDRSVDWIRVLLTSLFYYLLLAFSLIAMLLYRVFQLPAATQYICGESVELECFMYVIDQLVTTAQWQAAQFVIYIIISLVLWPVFNSAKGNVLLNLGLVSLLVSSLLLVSIEKNGPELFAGVFGPLLVALLIIHRRKRKIVFNKN